MSALFVGRAHAPELREHALVRAIQVANGDQIWVFALLELGELEEARERVRRIAVRGHAGRYAYEANNCVVMLAGLAEAEADIATATELVLSSGTGSDRRRQSRDAPPGDRTAPPPNHRIDPIAQHVAQHATGRPGATQRD